MTNLSTEERKQIAETIALQMGGIGRLTAMIGAKNFSFGSNGQLTFQFKSCKKANLLSVSLNSMDLYDMDFKKFNSRSLEVADVKTFSNVYAEDLKQIFEDFTGLYLSL